MSRAQLTPFAVGRRCSEGCKMRYRYVMRSAPDHTVYFPTIGLISFHNPAPTAKAHPHLAALDTCDRRPVDSSCVNRNLARHAEPAR